MAQLDQTDVDALLAEAESLADEVAGPAPAEPAHAPKPLPPPKPNKLDFSSAPPEIKRLLDLEVPVIVQLADRQMSMGEVLNINVGSVIEFDKRFDAELSLIVTNCCIGLGQAVKVGENFGLRITRIGTIYDKIRALGNK